MSTSTNAVSKPGQRHGYTTRKETAQAKAETRNRRQIRTIKYSGGAW